MTITRGSARPTTPPVITDPDAQAVLDWIQSELKDVRSLQNETLELELRTRNAAAENPREGMIVYADGTNWNPGYGEGPYVYKNGAWVPLSDGGWTLISTLAAASGTQVNFASIPQTYTDLLFEFVFLSHNDAGNQNLQVRLSTDNATSFETLNANTFNDAATINAAASTVVLGAATFAGARTVHGRLVVPNYPAAAFRVAYGQLLQHDGAGAGAGAVFALQTPAVNIDYVRFQWSAGSFDHASGSISMYGMRR